MSINWFPGHMAKARRQIEESLKKVDVVIEILDARIPYASKNPILDHVIGEKPRVVVLNKKDMASKQETDRWINHLKAKGVYPIALNGKEQNALKKIENTVVEATQEIFDRMARKGINPRAIRAMIVGIPNVGKSTIINNIAKRKVAKTGNTPGVTKAQQWIKAGSKMELLDTPGVLWPKFEDESIGQKLSLTGAIKDNVVTLDDIAIFALKFMQQHHLDELKTFYNINIDADTEIVDIFDAIGTARGFKMSGNEIDYERVTERVIYDTRNAKIGQFTFDLAEDVV
jgi:ribosome biogenesis GTPase A